MGKSKKSPVEVKIIQSESKEEFEKMVSEAIINGFQLGNFAVWSLSSSENAWYYFQMVYKFN